MPRWCADGGLVWRTSAPSRARWSCEWLGAKRHKAPTEGASGTSAAKKPLPMAINQCSPNNRVASRPTFQSTLAKRFTCSLQRLLALPPEYLLAPKSARSTPSSNQFAAKSTDLAIEVRVYAHASKRSRPNEPVCQFCRGWRCARPRSPGWDPQANKFSYIFPNAAGGLALLAKATRATIVRK